MSISLQQPIGSPFEPVFTFQDLLDVENEFPGTTLTVLPFPGNDAPTIVCIDSYFNTANQWCAPMPVPTPQFGAIYSYPLVTCTENCFPSPPCVDCGPHVVPEPGFVVVLLMWLIALVVWRWAWRRT